jgi:hypothetical protein
MHQRRLETVISKVILDFGDFALRGLATVSNLVG